MRVVGEALIGSQPVAALPFRCLLPRQTKDSSQLSGVVTRAGELLGGGTALTVSLPTAYWINLFSGSSHSMAKSSTMKGRTLFALVPVVCDLVLLMELLLLQGRMANAERAVPDELHDFCQFETFEASCAFDEVIVMRSARYGRIRISRCVKKDYGYLGCSTDVLPKLDKLCSGRRKCQVEVTDPNFKSANECSEEIKSYLEVKYTCAKVQQATASKCMTVDKLQLTAPEGYISNMVTEETDCGSEHTPYLIKVAQGQRVNITLMDFMVTQTRPQGMGSLPCPVYGTLKEPSRSRQRTICGRYSREAHAFTSETNAVEVTINRKLMSRSHHFLLHYQAVGCADLPAQPDTHIKYDRHAQTATIRCNNTHHEPWELKCRGTVWVGQMGNCTHMTTGTDELVLNVMSLPPGFLIAIVIGIAFCISLVILLLGVSYLHRRNKLNRRSSKQAAYLATSEDTLSRTDPYSRADLSIYEQRQTCVQDTPSFASTGYVCMWESPTHRKPEKIYSTGSALYRPLPCKCMPIRMKDLEAGELHHISHSKDSLRDCGFEYDPDIVRQNRIGSLDADKFTETLDVTITANRDGGVTHKILGNNQ